MYDISPYVLCMYVWYTEWMLNVLFSLHVTDGKKGKGRSGGSGREKCYHVSCPDVAQEASASGRSFSHSHVNANNLDYGYSSERSTSNAAFDCDDGNPQANIHGLINSSTSFPQPPPPQHYQVRLHFHLCIQFPLPSLLSTIYVSYINSIHSTLYVPSIQPYGNIYTFYFLYFLSYIRRMSLQI